MAIFKKESLARSVLFVFAFVLLSSVSFGAYGHPVPTVVLRYITFNHELRRVLGRAERDNFRNGITITGDDGMVIDPRQEIGEVPPSPQVAVTHYRISLVQRSLVEPHLFILDLSPVLNL